jgi:ADP-ribosyl-[dinitrogen reductase] hydrolase
VMTLLSLRDADGDADRFARKLAGRLRWWLAAVPAGVGLATARSIIRLMIGYSPARSGVWSAGNGPLMRAPIIGVWFADGDDDTRNRFTDTSTLITHRDPRALECARMISLVTAMVARKGEATTTVEILDAVDGCATSEDMTRRLKLLRQALERGDTVSDLADLISAKPGYVTGFAPDSATVAIYAWLRHRGDFRAAVEAVIRAGGDTDTIAFITGSIAAIECGTEHLPEDWAGGILDWPFNRSTLHRLSHDPPERHPVRPLLPVRNLLFFIIVLIHGFRRLLPPY